MLRRRGDAVVAHARLVFTNHVTLPHAKGGYSIERAGGGAGRGDISPPGFCDALAKDDGLQ